MIISNCFHENRINDKNNYIYSDIYLNYYLEKLIYKLKCSSDNDLINSIFKDYNKDYIKLSSLKNRFHELFGDKLKGKYILNHEIKNKIDSFNSIENKFHDIKMLEKFLLFSSISSDINSYGSFLNCLIIFIALNVKNGNMCENEGLAFLYNFIETINIKLDILENSISKIRKSYYKLSLFDLFNFNDIQKNICIKNNLNTIADLNNYNIYFLLYLFSINFENNINVLAQLQISVKKIIEKSFLIIGEKEYEILIKRNGYFSSNKLTLEEIGQKLNVTRERIRQIESKQIKKIKKISLDLSLVIYSFYYSELGKRNPYITLESLKNKYDEVFLNRMLLLFEYGDSNFTYDSKYKIIYDKNSNNIEEMKDEIIDSIGIVAEPKEIEKMDSFSLNIIRNNYKEITTNLYLKKRCEYRDLYLDLIEELYPKGFHISDEAEYKKFLNIVEERYNIYDNLPSKHSLEGMITRGNFIQIDKGTYLSKKYASSLNEKIIDNMLNYISQNEFTYYNTLFEMYKNQLIALGIKNRYYLKGCIDEYLTEDMSSKRDYITCGNTFNTPAEFIVSKMRDFNRKFTKSEIFSNFVGIKDYTIYNYLYTEIDNGLIWISSNEFVYLKDYDIEEETVADLKKFVVELFDRMNSELLTSKKIYARLQLMNKDLFNKLNLSNGNFELFSLMRALYNDLYFSRPYVSKHEIENNSRYSIIRNYVTKLDVFDFKIIQDYQSKMNVGGLYSYLQFMEDMSDEFVQIDIDKMVKIEKFNLDEIKVNEIKKILDLILNNFGEINTDKFNGYSLFPKISYIWNKYLLVGVIRSYLSNEFDITNTENMYNKTDFIIRRI